MKSAVYHENAGDSKKIARNQIDWRKNMGMHDARVVSHKQMESFHSSDHLKDTTLVSNWLVTKIMNKAVLFLLMPL